ncbi:MAG: omptin family outer membrane protease [Treponema sp.]|nr:omptin family outer membrane protease [Treponema sp.]
MLKRFIISSFFFVLLTTFLNAQEKNKLVIKVILDKNETYYDDLTIQKAINSAYMNVLQNFMTYPEISLRDSDTDKELREIQKQSQIDASVGLASDSAVYASDKGARADLALNLSFIKIEEDVYQMSSTISEIETMEIVATRTSGHFGYYEFYNNDFISDYVNELVKDLKNRDYISDISSNKTEVLKDASDEEQASKNKKSFKFFSMNLTPSFGLMNGMIKEYVVHPECTNTDNIESRLDWEVENIPVISMDADFFLFKYLYANFNFRVGINKSSGYMEDYDWLNFLDWPEDDPTELTNYSISNNRFESYYSFGARIGGNLNLPFKNRISPFIGFEYEFLYMTGSDGWYTYKSSDWEKKALSGDVISYKQEYNAFLLGLDIQSESIPRTVIRTSFMLCPYTMNLSSLDLHLSRNVGFLDVMNDSLMYKASAELMYKISEHHRAGLSGYLQYIPFTSGKDYSASVNSSGQLVGSYNLTGVEGASDRFVWQISLIYSFSL